MKRILPSILLSLALFQASAQSFDDCSMASSSTTITAGNYSVSAIDGSAPPNTSCDGVPSTNVDNSEWFKYIPDSDFSVTITSDLGINGDKDTRVNIYSGKCNNLVCAGGDDDSGTLLGNSGESFLSVAVFEVSANTTYYIVWDNKHDSNGFQFNLIENTPNPPSSTFDPITFNTQAVSLLGDIDRGMVDMNGDYLDDLVAISQSKIYINIQNPDGSLTSIEKNTPEADFLPTWSMAAGDYNADGYNDLMYGSSFGNTFMRTNQTGSDYTSVQFLEFTDDNSFYSQRTNFIDINNDGHLDAFACGELEPNASFINDGDNNLDFTISNSLATNPNGGNYGSIWFDVDNDRDLDVFVSKCSGFPDPGKKTNELYINNGDGTYTEAGASAGLADIQQTWSSAVGDFDNDGDMDIYVASHVRNAHKIMRNNGDLTFTDVSPGSGIGVANNSKENIAGDFNNDGFLDIASNGDFLFGNGDLTFNLVETAAKGAVGDINNDGFLDLFNGNLYLNQANDNNWVKIVTIGDQAGGNSNTNGIGARVEINTSTGTQIRDVQSGTGFSYMSTLNTHFGIGEDSTINFIRVYWPSGVIDNIVNPPINQTVVINENQTLDLQAFEEDEISVYPNPAIDKLKIKIKNPILQDAVYSIFNIEGKRVMNAALNDNTVDVSNLNSGSYLLRLTVGESQWIQKFIKQ